MYKVKDFNDLQSTDVSREKRNKEENINDY